MDRRIINEKIESLRRCVRRIEDKRVDSVAELERDWDTQDILSVNLTRAVQLCVDVAAHVIAASEDPTPDTMAETFRRLESMGILSTELSRRLQGSVGFRNIAIHAYRTIDWAIVHTITHEHLDDFRQFAQSILRYVEDAR